MVTRRRHSAAHHPVAHKNRPSHSLTTRLQRAAVSPAAKAAYVTIGTMGLTALAIGIFGPKRFQQEILKPARRAVTSQADRIWSDAQPLREQLGSLIERAGSSSGREKLVRSFQSWIGHFHAT